MPTFLEGVGNILDLPGSSVRDTLALRNPFNQWLPWNWLTQEGRTTGQELLADYGMGDDHPWLGLGVDIVTDPLTYAGFGVPAIAKGIRGATSVGRLRNLPKLAKGLAFGKTDDAIRAYRGLTTSEKAMQIAALQQQRKAAQAMRTARQAAGIPNFNRPDSLLQGYTQGPSLKDFLMGSGKKKAAAMGLGPDITGVFPGMAEVTGILSSKFPQYVSRGADVAKANIAQRQALRNALVGVPRMERAIRFATSPNVRKIGSGGAYLQLTSMGRESQPSYMESMMPVEAGPMVNLSDLTAEPMPYSFE